MPNILDFAIAVDKAIYRDEDTITLRFNLLNVVKDELMPYKDVKLTEKKINALAEEIVHAFAVKCGINQG